MMRLALWLMLCLVPRTAAAQDTVDQQLWLQVLATLRVSENWRLHLEEWPRFSNDQGGAFQVITRAALGRQFSPRITLWGGYAWIAKPPGPGVTHEQRLWQQLSATMPDAASWIPSLRLRLEQRFQDTWSDASHRFRVMGRGVRPLDRERRWSIATWNELLLTLDDTEVGPARGVDQNRLFGGLLRQFSPQVGIEAGYMWVTSDPPTGPRTHSHNLSVWLNLTP
jgi:hypothetical protein